TKRCLRPTKCRCSPATDSTGPAHPMMASSERMLPRSESTTMMGRAAAWIVALAVPAVIVLAWRYGLFSGPPRSYFTLLAGIGGLALGVIALAHAWRRSGLSPALLMGIVAASAFVAYCGP